MPVDIIANLDLTFGGGNHAEHETAFRSGQCSGSSEIGSTLVNWSFELSWGAALFLLYGTLSEWE
jgi:hypothetical protein